MDITECRAGKLKDGLECIFRTASVNELGRVTRYSCSIKSKDVYNILPETLDSTNDINYQPTNKSDPFRIGDHAVIWESLSPHQTGKSYDGIGYNPGMEFHPLYSVSEHNFPTKSKLGMTDVGEIFGEDNPSLVHPGWTETKFYGKDNVDYCKIGLYGRYDKNSCMVMHKALRSHIDIPGFINFGVTKVKSKKTFSLETASIADILIYARKTFQDKKVADRMAEGMIASKEGTFINLYVMMKNNFVPDNEVKKFMSEVSFETMKSIYKSKPDIETCYRLYMHLDKIQLQSRSLDENMKEVIVTSNIRPEDVKKYRENLINWILNYPKWKTILVGTGGRYQRDERYWFLKPMLQRALRVDKVIDPKVKPPEWLLQILKETNEPEVSIFGELKKVSELPEDLRSEFDLAKYSNVRSDTPQDTIMSIYPGMINIKKELVIAGFDPNELGVQGWGQFVHLLKIGRLWSMLEITTAWDRFVPSWIQDDPKIFYEWLQKVADSPTDPVYSVSQEELDAITTKLGKEAIIADTVVIIEEGDTLGETGDGMKKKAFAANLLNVSLNWDEWESWDDFESDKVPLQSWYETTSRVSKSRESTGDVFWNQLAKLAARGAIFKEDYKNIAKKLCNETRNEAIHPDTDVVVPDGVIMTGIDTADRQDINGYNSLTDEYSTFSSEGDLSCQDEE